MIDLREWQIAFLEQARSDWNAYQKTQEMMDILIELKISFGHDDWAQQLETANKLIKEMRAARNHDDKIHSTTSRRRRRLQKSA